MNDELGQRSMAEVPFGRAHRGMSIEKAENGFLVKAKFRKKNPSDEYQKNETLEFVFYTVDEVILFTQDYLSRKTSDFVEE